MNVIFDDGTMEATLYDEGWLFLRWMNNKIGYIPKKLIKDFIWAENYIVKNGLKGWFTSSELDHREFQMLLHKVGAQFMAKDAAFVYLKKWIEKAEDIHHVRKPPRRTPVTTISGIN